MDPTQKCSRCRTNKLLKFFKFRENTGTYYKTCIKCSEKHKCNQCDSKFSSNSKLLRHIRGVHDCIKDFECEDEECDAKFSQNSDLLRHIKCVHDCIKDFECDKCDSKFSSNSKLLRHIKCVHDCIKDFECDKCDYKCSENDHLSSHIKFIHDKIKNFECDKCDYKCSMNGTLLKHSKICTGKRNISSGEFQVIKSLSDLGFIEDDDYIFNQTYSSLTEFCSKSLRFDFIFVDHKIVIEYDGIQHYEPVRFGGMPQEQAEEKYKKNQITDKMKNDFCVENDYNMIRISYKDFADVLGILSDRLFDIVNWVG